MPKLITTQTRIADLGKPRIGTIGGGFGGLKVTEGFRGFKAQVILFDRLHHHTIRPFRNKVFTSLSWTWNYFSFDRINGLTIGRNEERLGKVKPEDRKLGVEI